MSRNSRSKQKSALITATRPVTPIHIKPDEIAQLIKSPTSVGVLEFFTGVAGSDKKDLMLAAGRVAQGALKGKLYAQLADEVWKLREKGAITNESLNSETGSAALSELIEFIDGETVDEKMFFAIKKLFFQCTSAGLDEKEQRANLYLLRVTKDLDSADIETLSACFNILEDPRGINTGMTAAGEWVQAVSDRLGYGLPALVERSEEKLIRLRLLHDRTFSDKSGVSMYGRFRLTEMATKLCKLLQSEQKNTGLY